MNNIKNIKIYFPFFYAAIQEKLTYRLNFSMWIMIEFLMVVMQLFMWNAIYNSSLTEVINGYTKYEMFLYIVIINAVARIVRISPVTYFKNDLKTGIIAMSLIKPINYRMQLFFKSISAPLINIIFLSIPYGGLLLFLYKSMGVEFDLNKLSFLSFLISILFALIISFQLRIILCIVIAYTTNGFGVVRIFDTLDKVLSGALIPINFFPVWAFITIQILPFKYIKYTPTSILLNRLILSEILTSLFIQVLWVLILEVILKKFWRKSLMDISVFGG